MKKLTTYNLIEDERIVDRVAILSDTGKLLNRKLFEEGKVVSEGEFAYDADDNLIEESERSEEGIKTGNRYTYDAEGEILGIQKMYQSEAFELLKYTYEPNKTTVTTMRDDEVFETTVEEMKEDGSEIITVTDKKGKVLKTQKTVPNDSKNSIEISIYNEYGDLANKVEEYYDARDFVVGKKEFDKAGNLMRVDAFELNDEGLILKHTLKTRSQGMVFEIQTVYTYDENENEVLRKVTDLQGNDIETETKKYNDENELVEEVFENFSGTLSNQPSYHKVIEIEEVKEIE